MHRTVYLHSAFIAAGLTLVAFLLARVLIGVVSN
jgi:hypothetical protein